MKKARATSTKTAKAASTTKTPTTKTPTTKAPKTSRAERRALRTEEIRSTAWQLVEEGGLAALTTTELARRTDAALGALYRFFPGGKQEVIAALQTEAVKQLHAELSAARARALSAATSTAARLWGPLVALADVWFAEARQHPARYRLIDEILSSPEAVHSDDAARALEGGANALLAIVKACVDDVVAAGVVGADDVHVRRFPWALWAALHGVSHFQKRDRIVDPDVVAARVAASLVVVLLRGLGASAADVDSAFAAVAPTALVR